MKFPMLFPVDGRPLPGVPDHIVETLRERGEEIRARTGCSPWYNAAYDRVEYHPGDEPRGAPVMDIIFQCGGYLPIDVDSTVQRIMESINTSWGRKVRSVDRGREAGKARAAETIRRSTADIFPEFMSRFKYLSRVIESPHSTRVFPMNVPPIRN